MNRSQQVDMIRRLLAQCEKRHDEKMLDSVVQIPVTKYTDESICRQELASVFSHFPLVAGHSCSLAERGSYFVSDWDGFPYFVIRGDDGRVRAFYNQCRHRGARLIGERRGCATKFVYPYHGWTYGMRGELLGIPQSHDFPGIDKADYGLVEIPAAEAGGLIWIARDPDTDMNIPEFLGSFYDDLLDFGVASLVQYKKSRVVKEANWKLLIQTYLEGYHVPVLHRDTLASAFKNGVLAHDESGPHIRLAAARTNINDAKLQNEEQWQIRDYVSIYYSFFPNTFFIFHPDYVSINVFWPVGPARTVWTHEMLYHASEFVGPSGQIALEKRFHFTNDVVFDGEDFAIAQKVQRSLGCGGIDHHVFGLAEGLLAMFQNNIDARIQ